MPIIPHNMCCTPFFLPSSLSAFQIKVFIPQTKDAKPKADSRNIIGTIIKVSTRSTNVSRVMSYSESVVKRVLYLCIVSGISRLPPPSTLKVSCSKVTKPNKDTMTKIAITPQIMILLPSALAFSSEEFRIYYENPQKK